MNAINVKPPGKEASSIIGGIVALVLAIAAFGYMYFLMTPFTGTPTSAFTAKSYDTSFIASDMQNATGIFSMVATLTAPQNSTPVVNYQPTDLGKKDILNYEQ